MPEPCVVVMGHAVARFYLIQRVLFIPHANFEVTDLPAGFVRSVVGCRP